MTPSRSSKNQRLAAGPTIRRYFGLDGTWLRGAVYCPRSPAKRMTVALMDADGRHVASCPANLPCDREGLPADCGFAIPVPLGWLAIPDEDLRFSFKVLESGVTFPEGGATLAKRRIAGRAEGTVWQDALAIEKRLEDVIGGLEPGVPVVVLGIHELQRTGAPMIALNLVRRIAARGPCRIVTLCLDGAGPLVEEFAALGPVVSGLRELFDGTRGDRHRLLGALRERAHPVALVNSLCSGSLAIALAAAGFQVVSLIHEYPYAFAPEWIATVARASADVIFPCTEVQAAFDGILHGLPCTTAVHPQGAYMLENPPPHAVDASAVRTRLGISPEEHLVLACGTIDTRKGFDWFTSFAIHFARYSTLAGPTHFVWLGKAFDQGLYFHGTHSLAANGVGHRFHHLAEMPDPAEVYAAADVLVMCSRIDPFPSVVLEAMGFGKPVLGFDQGQGSAGLIRDSGFGMVVPSLDMVAATTAIDHMLGDREFRDKVAADAPAFIRGKFRSDDHAAAVLARMEALAPPIWI